MLKDDHKSVKRLFREFKKEKDTKAKRAIVETALVELEVHTKLEEEIFYPAVRKEGHMADMMEEAEDEHHVVDVLAKEIKRLAPSDPDYNAKFTVLTENVEHHIKEEEEEMFVEAKRLGKDDLARLGARMEIRKAKLLKSTRPASSLSSSPAATRTGAQRRRARPATATPKAKQTTKRLAKAVPRSAPRRAPKRAA